MSDKLIPLPSAELIKASEAPFMLDKVRPAWQAKSLIERVKKLLGDHVLIGVISLAEEVQLVLMDEADQLGMLGLPPV